MTNNATQMNQRSAEDQEFLNQVIAKLNGEETSPAKKPTLEEHVRALRQELAALAQQVQGIGQVVEATGQAVGSLYAMAYEFEKRQKKLND